MTHEELKEAFKNALVDGNVDFTQLPDHYNQLLKDVATVTEERFQDMMKKAAFENRKDVTADEFIRAVKAGHFDWVLLL
jgi:hypothetical protein